jgi:hypothetical protein
VESSLDVSHFTFPNIVNFLRQTLQKVQIMVEACFLSYKPSHPNGSPRIAVLKKPHTDSVLSNFVSHYRLFESFWCESQSDQASSSLNDLNALLSHRSVTFPDEIANDLVRSVWPKTHQTDHPRLIKGLLGLLIAALSTSSPARAFFIEMDPLPHICHLYSCGVPDVQSAIQALIRACLPDIVVAYPVEIMEFLLSSLPGPDRLFSESGLAMSVLASLSLCCAGLPEATLQAYLGKLFEIAHVLVEPTLRYVFWKEVSLLLKELVGRRINLFEVDPDLFRASCQSLLDPQLQPYGNVIAMLGTLLYHFDGPELIQEMPIEGLLLQLSVSVHDDRDSVGILTLFSNLVVSSPELIGLFCANEGLAAVSELACQKSYPIRRAAFWLCWNIMQLGDIEQIASMLGDSDLAEALVDDVANEASDPERELIVASVQQLIAKATAAGDTAVFAFLGELEGLAQSGECPLIEPLFVSP